MLRYYMRAADALLPDGIMLTGAIAGSEGELSRQLCNGTGFLYVESPNRPLSRKWNSAVKLLRECQPDAILIVGSDDWLSHGLLRAYARFLRDGCDYVALKDVYLIHANTKRCLLFTGTTGVARMIRRDILDRLQWQLWPDTLNRSLDRVMGYRLDADGVTPSQPWNGSMAQVAQDAVAVDIKTTTNLWSFRLLARLTDKVSSCPYPEVMRHFNDIDRAEMEAAMQLECGAKH